MPDQQLSSWIDGIAGSLGYSMAKGNALSQGFATPTTYIAGRTIHGGLDIRGKLGTPITALRGGKVTLSRLNGGWGENVIIQTDDGSFQWYAHLNMRSVTAGQRVTTGQQIGTLGTTGYSTGPHLHFEIRSTAGQFYELLNPFTLYPDESPTPDYEPTPEQRNAFSDMLGIGVYIAPTQENSGTPHTQERYEQAVLLKRVFRAGDQRWVRLDGTNQPPS